MYMYMYAYDTHVSMHIIYAYMQDIHFTNPYTYIHTCLHVHVY